MIHEGNEGYVVFVDTDYKPKIYDAEFEVEAELPTGWAEDLSNYRAEEFTRYDTEDFLGDGEKMTVSQYYSNLFDFKDSDEVYTTFNGDVVVVPSDGESFNAEDVDWEGKPYTGQITPDDPDLDPVKADRNKDGKLASWERALGNQVAKGMREGGYSADSFEAQGLSFANQCYACGGKYEVKNMKHKVKLICYDCGELIILPKSQLSENNKRSLIMIEEGFEENEENEDFHRKFPQGISDNVISKFDAESFEASINNRIAMMMHKGKVKTLSGKPHTPRVLTEDKDITPEEMTKRTKVEAESFEAEDCKNVKAFAEYTCAKCGAERGLYEVEDGNFYRFDPDIGGCECGGFDVHSNDFITCRECDDYFHHRGDGWAEHLRIIMNRNEAESFEAQDCYVCGAEGIETSQFGGQNVCSPCTDWKYEADEKFNAVSDEYGISGKRFNPLSRHYIPPSEPVDEDDDDSSWEEADWDDGEELEEEDIFDEVDWQAEGVATPKPTTIATLVGIGALAAYLAPQQIRDFFKNLGK